MTTQVQTLPVRVEAPPAQSPFDRLARGGGWWTFIFGFGMLIAVTEALNAAAWSDGLEVVRLAVLGGALLGFALSLTRWDGFFTFVYSLLGSVVWISTLFNQLLFHDMTTREGVVALLTLNAEWIRALINGTSGEDNLVFVTQLAVLGWWIGYLAFWSLFRHRRVLVAILPAGAALLVNSYYAQAGMTGYLVLFLGAVLLLAIRIELARNETRWQVTRVRYAPDIALDFLRAGLAFTVVVMAFTWLAPDLRETVTMERVMRPFEGPWQRMEDTWSRMYKSLNYGQSAQLVSSFGKSMSLGGAVNLTDREIFEAQTPERTYWRAAAYDLYTGQGWQNTSPEVEVIEAREPLGEPLFDARTEMTVTVKPLEQGQEVIFAPPQPLRIGVPVSADFVASSTPNAAGVRERSISLLRNRTRMEPDEIYSVVSSRTTASRDRLRTDLQEYPVWLQERYLQVPEGLPERVRQMAAQVAGDLDNPYDQAEAIEAALRTYTYNQQISAPPAGRDGVDWFLFDSREGYCDYYASAFVVMMRSLGVPARMAVGYTPGNEIQNPERDPDPDLRTYRILERNAHAWPEVYFPSYGWVQFEPTASEPLLSRPLPESSEALDEGLVPDAVPPNTMNEELFPPEPLPEVGTPMQAVTPFERWLRSNWGWFATVAGLALAIAAVAAFIRWQRQSLFRDSEVLARLFNLLGLWARRLRIPWRPSQTPLEKAASFNTRLPEAAPAVDTLANLFIAQQYGRQRPAPEKLHTLSNEWEKLLPRLWQRWLVGQVRGPEEAKARTGRKR
jgi:transglutaminase-like putative cysteine protease